MTWSGIIKTDQRPSKLDTIDVSRHQPPTCVIAYFQWSSGIRYSNGCGQESPLLQLCQREVTEYKEGKELRAV